MIHTTWFQLVSGSSTGQKTANRTSKPHIQLHQTNSPHSCPRIPKPKPPKLQTQGLKLLAALLPSQPPAAAATAVLRLCPSTLTQGSPDARNQLFELLRDSWQRLESAAAAGAAAAAVGAGGGGGGVGGGGARGRKRGREGGSSDDEGRAEAGAERMEGMEGAGAAEEGAEQAKRDVESALFVLLGDASPEVARQAAGFWHSVLPRTPGARLGQLLERARGAGAMAGDGAAPAPAVPGWRDQLQSRWSQAAAGLVLRLPADAAGFEEPLFDQPLSRWVYHLS